MWEYSKKLQYPVRIKRCNPAMAKLIISQLGGLNFNKLYKVHYPLRTRIFKHILTRILFIHDSP